MGLRNPPGVLLLELFQAVHKDCSIIHQVDSYPSANVDNILPCDVQGRVLDTKHSEDLCCLHALSGGCQDEVLNLLCSLVCAAQVLQSGWRSEGMVVPKLNGCQLPAIV